MISSSSSTIIISSSIICIYIYIHIRQGEREEGLVREDDPLRPVVAGAEDLPAAGEGVPARHAHGRAHQGNLVRRNGESDSNSRVAYVLHNGTTDAKSMKINVERI